MLKYLPILLLTLSAASPAFADEQIVTGYIESVILQDGKFQYDAKLDTGADNSSINAEIISYEKGEGGLPKRVKFKLTDKLQRKQTLEKEVTRVVTIKSKVPGHDINRPVVYMEFCIAGRIVGGDINLADRRQFNYPVLIGRNMLGSGNLLVDSEKTYQTKPECGAKPVVTEPEVADEPPMAATTPSAEEPEEKQPEEKPAPFIPVPREKAPR